MSQPSLSTLSLNLEQGVAEIRLNRPDKSNAMNDAMWQEIRQAFAWADATPEIRVAILSGEGRNFCAGIDLAMLGGIQQRIAHPDGARSREMLRRLIRDLQDCLTAIERCRKPVIAAIHGSCVGGGLDLAAACDLRYCSADATFCLKEVDIAIVADVGVVQRLSKIVGDGRTRELAYTARQASGEEAARMGLVSESLGDREALAARVQAIAESIAAKSPVTVRGLKENLVYSRDHSVAEGLRHAADWNAAMLMSEDLDAVAKALRARTNPVFRD